ncbi:MAG: hypothetical protein JWN48_5610 [Myxococcaceae bacterium]|nr:hypothetical protein [Myxococcaceae bacterium]
MLDWKRCVLSGLFVASVAACGSDDTDEGKGGNTGDGGNVGQVDGGLDGGVAGKHDASISTRRDASSTTGGGDGDGGDDNADCDGLMAHIRDFKSDGSHPDFETYYGSGTKGLLEDTLGSDGKPVFNSSGNPVQITSAASFAQWYHDTPGVNINVPYTIPLTQVAGNTSVYEFSSNAFFPIDNKGWATPPATDPMLNGHNFSFTTEVHTSFTYHGGENFMFMGDDDLWIFVNGKLALDLGGLHSSLSGNIDFDAMATQLGITRGMTYRMDIFHAERHTNQSNFTVRTNIDCFVTPPIAI